jgi:hypothetical protein
MFILISSAPVGRAILAHFLRSASPERKSRRLLAADLVVVDAAAGVVESRAGDDYQRQEVLLARVAVARMRRFRPLFEAGIALVGRRPGDGVVQPPIEGRGCRRRFAIEEGAQVVIAVGCRR